MLLAIVLGTVGPRKSQRYASKRLSCSCAHSQNAVSVAGHGINPMTTQRGQQKKQKPHRGHVSAHTRQVHRSVIPMILYQMGIRTHRINIVSLT